MSDQVVNRGRRRFLVSATTVVGAVGVVGIATPFLASWQPSARARAAGAPVTADISRLAPGQQMTIEWRGKPVWVVRRTPEMIADIRAIPPQSCRTPSHCVPSSPLCRCRAAFHQAGICGVGGYLHAPGLLAWLSSRDWCGGSWRGLAGRLSVCLSWVQVRSRRASLHRSAGTFESGGAAASLRASRYWWWVSTRRLPDGESKPCQGATRHHALDR